VPRSAAINIFGRAQHPSTMARYSALRWQFWLYLLRLVSFLSILVIGIHSFVTLFGIPPYYLPCTARRLVCLFPFLLAPFVVVVNDIALYAYLVVSGNIFTNNCCRLVWDANFSGGVIATACFQTVMSLFAVAFLIFRVRGDLWTSPTLFVFGYRHPRPWVWLGVAFEILSMIISLVLIIGTLRACWNKPIRRWTQGVKELAIHPIPLSHNPVTTLGKRRPAHDGIRIVWVGACGWGIRATMRFLKLGLTRRIQ
jgi:hypothetical protein